MIVSIAYVFAHSFIHKTLPTGTESNIRLLDVDKDGVMDILFGVASQLNMEKLISSSNETTVREYCKLQGTFAFFHLK